MNAFLFDVSWARYEASVHFFFFVRVGPLIEKCAPKEVMKMKSMTCWNIRTSLSEEHLRLRQAMVNVAPSPKEHPSLTSLQKDSFAFWGSLSLLSWVHGWVITVVVFGDKTTISVKPLCFCLYCCQIGTGLVWFARALWTGLGSLLRPLKWGVLRGNVSKVSCHCLVLSTQTS